MDRASGLSVWAAKARPGPGRTIEVGAAGAYEHRSNGLDKRNPRSDSTVNYRSRGAIPDSMVIRRDRLDWAVANDTDLGYVLHLFLVETDTSAGHVSPMVGHESDKYGFGAEGTRIAIDPSIDLSKRGLSPAGLAVARTLQTRGAYIGDNSGSQTALKAEQETSAQPVWDNRLREDDLEGVSWRDFVVIRSAAATPSATGADGVAVPGQPGRRQGGHDDAVPGPHPVQPLVVPPDPGLAGAEPVRVARDRVVGVHREGPRPGERARRVRADEGREPQGLPLRVGDEVLVAQRQPPLRRQPAAEPCGGPGALRPADGAGHR
jgi:hypothetical protein